jgi:hypothetical protein
MSTDKELVSRIVASIRNNEDYTLCVKESLRYVLKACSSAVKGRGKMELGLGGLPKCSAKLVEMGVFYIDGNYVYVHREIYVALQEKQRAFNERLKRLQSKAEQQQVDS